MGWLRSWFERKGELEVPSVPLTTGEAKLAIVRAEGGLQDALSRSEEVAQVASQLRGIGDRNHFAERIDIAWRRKEAET